jgi:hypothetical protein
VGLEPCYQSRADPAPCPCPFFFSLFYAGEEAHDLLAPEAPARLMREDGLRWKSVSYLEQQSGQFDDGFVTFDSDYYVLP